MTNQLTPLSAVALAAEGNEVKLTFVNGVAARRFAETAKKHRTANAIAVSIHRHAATVVLKKKAA